MAKKRKTKRRSGGINAYQRLVNSNKGLKAARSAKKKAEARAKKAYKKAVSIAKKKMKSRRK